MKIIAEADTQELIIIERLKQKFFEFDINFDDFCNLLIDNNAFLSGSFLLQVIQNRFFTGEEYDIDIFTFGEKNKTFEENIKNLLKNAICKKHILINHENNITHISDGEFLECVESQVTIFDRYKQINRCIKNKIHLNIEDYESNKIKNIVDFECFNKTLHKHQLIYYDDKKYKIPEDIITNFDFDFCANYFDGKIIFVKNYDSINSASCTLNLERQRIYNNENKRIIKYIKRGYNINAKFDDDIYEILYLTTDKNNELKPMSNDLSNAQNLIIICDSVCIDITNYLKNLSSHLEKIIIYTYPTKSIIENLPSSVKELRLYIWKSGTGIIGDTLIKEKRRIKLLNEEHKIVIENAISNIKKIPFDCKIFINDEHIEL